MGCQRRRRIDDGAQQGPRGTKPRRTLVGTSTDRTAGSGGAWTPLKHAAASYVRGVRTGSPSTRSYARRVLSRHVPVLGGSSGATSGARAGRAGIQRLGALLG